jgi:inorganic phosphate transporter, PiT family
MNIGLAAAVVLAIAFAVTDGPHDAANSIALVARRAAKPFQAIVSASVFDRLGPAQLGAAVVSTIAGIVTVAPSAADQGRDGRTGAR